MKNWTKEEDQLLTTLVETHRHNGRVNWEAIPLKRFKRTKFAIQHRWNHVLKNKPAKAKAVTRSYLWGLYTVTR